MWERRLGRLFSIVAYLSPHSQVTIEDLAREYEVDMKTIRRDLKILRSAQLGIFLEQGKIKISRIGYRRIQSWMVS